MANTVLDTPYSYLGYYIKSIKIDKTQTSKIKNVVISIDGFSLDEKKTTFVLGVKVSIEFDDTDKGEILFISGFEIIDEDGRKELASINELDGEEKLKITTKWLPVFLRTLFPFIRERIHNLTSDCEQPVLLPTLDMTFLRADQSIEISRE